VSELGRIFLPQAGLLEMLLRGTVIYWALFILLRLAGRRDVGSLGTADLLVLVLVADAAGSAMSGSSTSVIDGIYVVATIVFWSVLISWANFHIPGLHRFLEPARVCLVRDGRLDLSGMRSEHITRRELMEQLRLQGIGSLDSVRRAYLESNGEISVITVQEPIDGDRSTLQED